MDDEAQSRVPGLRTRSSSSEAASSGAPRSNGTPTATGPSTSRSWIPSPASPPRQGRSRSRQTTTWRRGSCRTWPRPTRATPPPPPRQARTPPAAPTTGLSRSTTRRWELQAPWSPTSSRTSTPTTGAMIPPNCGRRSRASGWCLDREPCSPRSTGTPRSSGYAPMTAARTTGWTATRSAGAGITSSAWNSRCPRTARLAQQPPAACRRRARKMISRDLLSGLARSASPWQTRLLRLGRRRTSRLGGHALPERSPLLRRPRNGGGERARTPRSRTPGSSCN